MLAGTRIINVMAASLDGKIAASPGETDQRRLDYGFTNQFDQDHLLELIRKADAVITGAGSLRVTRAVADVAPKDGRNPIWVILSKSGLSPDLEFWGQDNIERWVVGPGQPEDPAYPPSDTLRFLDPVDKNCAEFLIEELTGRGAKTIVVLGGSEINFLFYQSQLVTELIITICPFIFATLDAVPLVAPPLQHQVKFALLTSHVHASHVFLHYGVQEYTFC